MQLPLDIQALARSPTLRFITVGALSLILAVPLAVVSCVTQERQQFHDEAVKKVARSYAGSQRFAGPIIAIPLVERRDAALGPQQQYLFVMPKRLNVRMHSTHDMRAVGIFDIPALNVAITAEGEFDALNVEALTARHGPLRWEKAVIGALVSSPAGILDADFQWRDASLPLTASTNANPLGLGLAGALADPADGGSFALTMALRGTERLSVVPVGDHSTVEMRSTWPHPSFDGRFLPETPYAIDDTGFVASWRTLHLARGFADLVAAPNPAFLDGKDLGFRVYEPASHYALVDRSVKYGVLFVVLTFVSVLCLELSTGRRFHIVQYGVTGIGLVLFFLTLLALAEHIGFGWAYLAAAVTLTGMTGGYVRGATGEWPLTTLAAAILATLYGVLYALLRLEDFALVVGVGVLLAALGMLMWTTRKLTPTALAPRADDERRHPRR